jgi:hypothetical protein
MCVDILFHSQLNSERACSIRVLKTGKALAQTARPGKKIYDWNMLPHSTLPKISHDGDHHFKRLSSPK